MSLRRAVKALFRRLFTPWWREPPSEALLRRQRLMINGPFATLIGVAFGALAADRWELSLLFFPAFCGFASFYMIHLIGRIESLIRSSARVRGPLPTFLVRVGGDVVGGGILGQMMALVLGTNAAASLAAGASLLFAYSYVTTRLLFGNWVDDLIRWLSGHHASRRENSFSYPESLEAQGMIDEALAAYEEAVREGADPAAARIAAGWMLRRHGRPSEAVDWFRRALDEPRIGAVRASAVVRQIQELCAVRLGDPGLAIPDLERLRAVYGDARDVEWADQALEALRALPSGE